MTSPDRAALLAAYDAQLRAAGELSGRPAHRIGPLWLAQFPGRGFLTYDSLGGMHGDELDALIDTAVAYYRDETDVPMFEWKTRGHDEPADLTDRLAARGFEPDDEESVMAGDVEGVIADVPLPEGVRIRRVAADDLQGYTWAHEMQAHVFGQRFGTPQQDMERAAGSDGARSLWVAESGEEAAKGQPWGPVVCAGTIDVVRGTDFAGIWGGSALEHWRGKGIYRALTSERAKAAKAAGARYLQSDSTEYSRPILERSGLVKITTTTPWNWTRA